MPSVRPPAEPPEEVAPAARIAAAWSWRILVVAGGIALVGYLVVQLRLVVVPVLVALLLSALLVPLARWLQRHRWPKALAVAVSEVGVLAIVVGLILLIVSQIRSGYPALRRQTLARYDDLLGWLRDSPLDLSKDDIRRYIDQGWTQIQRDSSGLLSGAAAAGSTVAQLLAGVLLVLFTTLFILIDGRRIWGWTVGLFPRRARAAVSGAGEAGWHALTVFVRVQILVAFIDALGIGLGAFLLGRFTGGFPLVIPIAVAVFLGSFVPVVGAVLTGALAVFVALVFLGPLPAVIMVGIVLLVQQIEGHVLQPFVMGHAVKIHPLAVVLSVAALGFAAGIPGALFAVPAIAVANVMVVYIARGRWRTDPRPDERDVTTRLRPGEQGQY